MIGTIVIGSGNNRIVIERERSFRMSLWASDGIKRRLGIKDRPGAAARRQKGR